MKARKENQIPMDVITRLVRSRLLLFLLVVGVTVSMVPSLRTEAAPLLQGKTYDGVEFPKGDISFADRVVSYTPGARVESPYNDPTKALGPPDQGRGMGTNAVSLGDATTQCQAELILEFVDNYLVDVPGNDLWIFEAGPLAEETEIFISTDNRNWIALGRIEGHTYGLDISDHVGPGQRFPFVRLCDLPGKPTGSGRYGGPDIDSVGAIGTVFRPKGERTPPGQTGDQAGPVSQRGACGLSTGAVPPSGGAMPWDTPTGQGCFERWIAEAMSRLNAYDDDDFNANKPYSINKYGLLEGKYLRSAFAPDNFPQYNNNKYWWMWDHYTVESVWDWDKPNWRGARVPPLRSYVLRCLAEMGGTGTGQAGVTGGGLTVRSTVPGNDFLPPPFGAFPEPDRWGQMALQAGQRRVRQDALVNLPVWLINGANVANTNFNIVFDNTVARPEGDLVRGSLLDQALFEFNTAETNLIRVGFAQQTGISGTGTVSEVPFLAVGKPGSRTDVCLEVTTINDPGGTVLTIDRIHGFIEIVDPEDPGLLQGDCKPDGILDAWDAFCALQISVRLRPVLRWMDMDGSGDVTSRDATIILQQDNVPRGS